MNQSIKTNYIINLDALSALKEFPENLFDSCITSPPYYGLRDYHHESQIGREDSPEAYLNNLVEVFRQVRRVLKEDGSLWLVIGDLYASTKSKEERPAYKPKDLMGLPWQLALKLREDGWYLRSDIIWHKENAMPESCRDRPTRSYEHIFLLTKSKSYYYNYDALAKPLAESSKRRYLSAVGKDNKYMNQKSGMKRQSLNEPRNRNDYTTDTIPKKRNARDIWTINTSAFRGKHYACFPPKLVKTCILAGCPEHGLILDPFMGSGTVGMVAKKMNRQYIGIEINRDYCQLAKKRIEEGR